MTSERTTATTAPHFGGRPVLLTGAAGALGRVLLSALHAEGVPLIASDIRPFPDALPSGVRYVQADLGQRDAVLDLARGVGCILHFGGLSVEHPFEPIMHANVRGTQHVFEAAARESARVIFASSNHAIGFHERSERLAEDCALRPDGFYGWSKAVGELMARLYHDKHGVESVSIRIGSSFPTPRDRRMLSTWMSYRDLVSLVRCCMETPAVGCMVAWGISDNPRRWWSTGAWQKLGFVPQDTAETFADQVDMSLRDAVSERYQGGTFCADGYTRKD